jgi:plastocyanin
LTVLALLLTAAAASASIHVTYTEAQEFFEGRKAKSIYFNAEDRSQIMMIDYSQNPLQEVMVTNQAGDGNPQISHDGTRVAFHRDGTAYVCKLEANTNTVTASCEGINPHWWVHPSTGKEYLLVQRGIVPGGGNGIWAQEIANDGSPVGSAQRLLDEPMANAGRSPDGKYMANNDEEHERCMHGHGLYVLDDPHAVSNASILYWVYETAPGWYSGGGPAYRGYCNGSMSSAPPGHQFYGAMLHMGSGHTEVYIRQPLPSFYENETPVRLGTNGADGGSGCTDDDMVIPDFSEPLVTIRAPKYIGIGGEDHWGYSDWAAHPDYMTGTCGGSSSSRGNTNGYLLNIAKFVADESNFGIQFSHGGVAQPDLWVSNVADVNITSPADGEELEAGQSVTIQAEATAYEGSITGVEFFVDDASIGTASSTPYQASWAVTDGYHNLKAVVSTSSGWSQSSPVVRVLGRSATTAGKIVLDPAEAAIKPGETASFSATAYDQYDVKILPQPTVQWSAPAGGQVDANGTFTAPASGEGTFIVRAAVSHGGQTVSADANVFVASFNVKVNFQESSSYGPPGFVADDGSIYRDRGNGYTYGWTPDNTDHARKRDANGAIPYITLNHMAWGDARYEWNIEVPNGTYTVNFVVGDPSYFGQPSKIEAEGELVVDVVNSEDSPWDEVRQQVEVGDGKLTLTTPSGANAKLCFVEITSYSGPAHTDMPPVRPMSRGVAELVVRTPGRGQVVIASGIAGKLRVIDSRGRTIVRRSVQAGVPAAIDELAPGSYRLRVVTADGRRVLSRNVAVIR